MAIIGTEYNARDVVTSMDSRGNLLPVVDVIANTNEFMDYFPWVEANEGMQNKSAHLTSRPTPTVGRVNKGTGFGKAVQKVVADNVARIELNSRADERLFSLGMTDMAKWRFTQDTPIMKAFGDAVVDMVLYGDEKADSGEFNGVMPRYDALPTDPFDQEDPAYNVLDGGGVGSDNTSIIVARMSANDGGLCGLYPRGSMAGLQVEDLGRQFLEDENNAGTYLNYYVTHFAWNIGIKIEDPRNVVRIANIDVNNLIAGSGADLFSMTMDAIRRIPGRAKDGVYIMANREVIGEWSKQQRLTQEQFMVAGTDRYIPVDTFAGIPILRTDNLLLTESAII